MVVSVEAGAPRAFPDADFGFLFCESLVEVVLVLVEAAMDEEIEDGGEHRGEGDRYMPGLYTFAFATWRDMK